MCARLQPAAYKWTIAMRHKQAEGTIFKANHRSLWGLVGRVSKIA